MAGTLSEHDIAAWLDWLDAAGVGDAVSDDPSDWFEIARRQTLAGVATRASPPPVQPPGVVNPSRAAPVTSGRTGSAGPLARPPAPISVDATVLAARREATSARSLEELRARLERFEGCGLRKTAKSLCFYRGAARTRLMLIGEAPGREEDLQGKPFVGPAGQLLDRMLAAIGLGESDVHITNSVYWRPPGNRPPTVQEMQVCQPFLERQVELVGPDFLVLLGGVATKQLLGAPEGIMRLRGNWRSIAIGGRELPTLATLPPSHLLLTPAHKRLAWRDLLMVEAALRSGS